MLGWLLKRIICPLLLLLLLLMMMMNFVMYHMLDMTLLSHGVCVVVVVSSILLPTDC